MVATAAFVPLSREDWEFHVGGNAYVQTHESDHPSEQSRAD